MVNKKDILSEEQLKEEARKTSVKEGSSYSLMEGFGVRFITPFALALGAGTKQISFLSSMPGLLGNLSQLGTSRLMQKFPRKKIVFLSVLSQSLMWLPLIFIGFLYFHLGINSSTSVLLVIISYSLLVLLGAIAGPAWTSWMKDLVTSNSGVYFGKRNRIVGALTLLSIFIAGLILYFFKADKIFYAFAILFFIAFLGRVLSAYFFTKQYEPKFEYNKESHFSFRQFLKKMFSNNFGKFVVFTALISFGTAVASPFFAVYMLRDLSLSYLSFTLITFSPVFMNLVFMPLWGSFNDKYGNVKTMKITGLLISLVPLFWLASYFLGLKGITLLVYLVFAEAFSGIIWAGFNLATGNFIYDAVTRERTAICVTYFNIINAFGAFIGALLGGYLGSLSLSIFSSSSLLLVFLLSGILRLLSAAGLNLSVREVRDVEKFSVRKHAKEQLKTNFGYLWSYLGFRNIRSV